MAETAISTQVVERTGSSVRDPGLGYLQYNPPIDPFELAKFQTEAGGEIQSLDQYCRTPIDIRQLDEFRQLAGRVFENTVRLAPMTETTQHLPTYSLRTLMGLRQSGHPVTAKDGYCGRVAEITLATHPDSAGDGWLGAEEYVAFDLNWAPGEIVRQAAILEAKESQNPVPSYLEDLSYAFAVYMPDAKGKKRLADVMTGADMSPSNGFFDVTYQPATYDPKTHEITGVGEEVNERELLSTASKEFEYQLRAKLGENFDTVVDGFIEAWGRQFSLPNKDLSPKEKRKVENYHYDNVKHDGNSALNKAIKDLMNCYKQFCTDPLEWRVPVRAFSIYKSMENDEKQLSWFTRHLTGVGWDTKAQHKARKDNIRKEVVQAIGMQVKAAEYRNKASIANGMQIDPVRYVMKGIDPFDRAFAKSLLNPIVARKVARLMGITTNEGYEDLVMPTAILFGTYDQLPEGVQLYVNPTPGNNVVRRKYIKAGFGSKSPANKVYVDGDDVEFDQEAGLFPEEIYNSMSDSESAKTVDNAVPGWLGTFRTESGDIKLKREMWAANLLRSPRFLANIIAMGYFENKSPGLPDHPTPQEQLRNRLRAGMALGKVTTKGIEVVKVVREAKEVEFYRSADKKSIVLKSGKAEDRYKVEKAQGHEIEKGAAAGEVALVKTEEVLPGEVYLGRVVLQGSAFHGGVRPNSSPAEVSMMIMPSVPRPSSIRRWVKSA